MSESLFRKLHQLQYIRDSTEERIRVPHPTATVFGAALETQSAGQSYSWEGLKRGGDPAHPFVLFQYTLSGWGYYRQAMSLHPITQQMAFTALIPSNHHYYLPTESPHWTFFWLIIRHPYVVKRIADQLKEASSVLTLSPDSLLIKRALEILEQMYAPSFLADPFAEEEALFRFMLEYERTLFYQRHPQSERTRLLQATRSLVLQSLPQSLDVEKLASQYQMSRSAFSHYFKNVTGLSPAAYFTQVRLEEATGSLLRTRLPLEEIAAQTGFANATHFCKVFRRHFQLSPGEFRRQMQR